MCCAGWLLMGVAPRIPGGGSHFKSLIPVMTANSQNGYIVSASNKLDGEPYYAFDVNCKIKNWAETNGGTQYVFASGKSGYFQIQFPSATEVTGAIVVGPNYNKAGVRIGGCIGLSYSDDGSNFVYTPSHIVMIPGNAGDEKAISEHLKSVKGCAKSAVGAHKYWRLDFAVWQEFIGINQIVLF